MILSRKVKPTAADSWASGIILLEMALGGDKPLFKIDANIFDQVVTVFGTPNEEEKKVMDLTSETNWMITGKRSWPK